MYCIVDQRVLPPLSDEQRYALVQQAALHTLADLLEAVPDPRGRHSLRYDLPFLLCSLIAALLCNLSVKDPSGQPSRRAEAPRRTSNPALRLIRARCAHRAARPVRDRDRALTLFP
jgi:hypothetical protein